MANILQIVKDYGPAFAAVLSIVALVVVIIMKGNAKQALNQILKLKDDTRNEKSKVIVEAFNIITKLEQTNFEEYKFIANELDTVYNRMYSVITDAKLIQAYDRVITIFLTGGKPNFLEFQVLARKELGLNAVNNKSKQNYLLLLENEEQKEKTRQELEEQKRLEELELEKQKQTAKEKKEEERLRKIEEKEKAKEEKKRAKENKKEPKQEIKEEVIEPNQQVEEVKEEEQVEPVVKDEKLEKPTDDNN